MERAPRLLLLLGQSPFDPTSGAAQSMRQCAELLAARGWQVRALATRGCEGASQDTAWGLAAPDGSVGAMAPSFARGEVAVSTLSYAGIDHEIVHSDPALPRRWETDVGDVYQAHLERLLRAFRPDVVYTYGDDPGDRMRRALARSHGAAVVFGLHNLAYREPPPHVDHFVAPSDFLARRYRQRWPSAKLQMLPTVLMPDAVRADAHEPVFVTFLNPEPAKGAARVARLAARLGRERPDIPLLIVEGRARADNLLQLARAQGTPLEAYDNILFAPATPTVKALWAGCRVLLMPSLVEEAAGRAALEAMANGAVPLVSDRGALPETVGDGGIVLPVADASDETVDTRWFAALTRLVDDEPAYEALSARARSRAARHLPPALGPAIHEVFVGWAGHAS